MTSAPSRASWYAANGPASTCVMSMILIPSYGLIDPPGPSALRRHAALFSSPEARLGGRGPAARPPAARTALVAPRGAAREDPKHERDHCAEPPGRQPARVAPDRGAPFIAGRRH